MVFRKLLIALLALAATPAFAQNYPTKPVRLVISFTPGSSTDIIGRVVAAKLQEMWGQPVVAENRVGAGGTVGSAVVAKADPDGYTLLANSSAHVANPGIYANMPYDTLKDFTNLALLGGGPNVLIVSPAAGWKSLRDLVDVAKASPGKLNFSSAGIGSGTHFNLEKLKIATGIDVTHIPYKGTPEAIAESNPVIVAGFGRFGQVVVRVLRGLGIGATVIDHDPGQIDTVRRFGWKAYYGDATRMDLLESAGAASARVLLVAIDDPEAALATVKRVRQRFPQLEVIARARSRTDAYEYAELGVPAVREVFGSALEAAERVLRTLGFAEDEAARIVRRFHDYDEAQIPQGAPYRHDVKKLVALSEQGRRDIAQLLAAEARNQRGAGPLSSAED